MIALDSLYIESRYPGNLGLLPEGKPTIKQAQLYYEFAQKVYAVVKFSLENKQ